MKRRIIILALATLVSASFNVANAANDKKKKQAKATTAAPITLTTSSDSLSYAAGMSHTNGLMQYVKSSFGVNADDADALADGFEATMKQGMNAKTRAYAAGQIVAHMVMERFLPGLNNEIKGSADSIDVEKYTLGFANALRKNQSLMADTTAKKYFESTVKQIDEKRNEAVKAEGEAFLAANAKKEGVKTLPSGLQYKVITEGTGEVATANDEVTVKYEGHLIDGTEFDSSYKRGDGTTKFRPNQVIAGWKEALTMMPVGSKWELYVPQNLGYGSRKSGPIPAYSTLIFTVELVKINHAEAKKTTTTTK